MSELETQNAEEKKMSSECLEMSKAESLIVEFFNNADSVQVEEGAWYYSESSVEAELLEVYAKLAKANERVAELEQANLELAANVEACCELTDMDMGAAIERLFEIDNTESKALLNKFAIEQKVEAVTVFASSANEMGQFGWSDCQWLTDYAEEWVEQLSKEQTSE